MNLTGPTVGLSRPLSALTSDQASLRFEGWWFSRSKQAEPASGQDKLVSGKSQADKPVAAPEAPAATLPLPKPPKPFNPKRMRWWRATLLNGEYWLRVLGAKIQSHKLEPMADKYIQRFEKLKPNTPEYFNAMLELTDTLFLQKLQEIEVNFESAQFKELVNSDEACLFIINHDHQMEDPAMLGLFTSMLYQGYIDAGRAATCPMPKIILNKDIVETMGSEKTRQLFEFLGAVPVDASVGTETQDNFTQVLREWLTALTPKRFRPKKKKGPDGKPVSSSPPPKKDNNRVLLPVLKGFNENKNHVFLFPEGRHAGETDDTILMRLNLALKANGLGTLEEMDKDPATRKVALKAIDSLCPTITNELLSMPWPLEDIVRHYALSYRFQPGVANIVNAALKRKKRVKVVPLGFNYYNLAADSKRPGVMAKLGLTKAVAETKIDQQLGSVYVGKPMIFERQTVKKTDPQTQKEVETQQVTVTCGNLKEPETSPWLEAPFRTLAEGQPRPFVYRDEAHLTMQFLRLMCENLRVCKVKSQQEMAKTLQNGMTKQELAQRQAFEVAAWQMVQSHLPQDILQRFKTMEKYGATEAEKASLRIVQEPLRQQIALLVEGDAPLLLPVVDEGANLAALTAALNPLAHVLASIRMPKPAQTPEQEQPQVQKAYEQAFEAEVQKLSAQFLSHLRTGKPVG